MIYSHFSVGRSTAASLDGSSVVAVAKPFSKRAESVPSGTGSLHGSSSMSMPVESLEVITV